MNPKTLSENQARGECERLALERGYRNPRIVNGALLVDTTTWTYDYADEVLAPRGLIPWEYRVKGWLDAKRLLSMLPPARGHRGPPDATGY